MTQDDIEAVRTYVNSASFPLSRTQADRILATITHLLARAEQAERERGEALTVVSLTEQERNNYARHTGGLAAKLQRSEERIKELERAAAVVDRELQRKHDQLAARDAAIAESLRRADQMPKTHFCSDAVADAAEPLRQFQQPEPDKLVEVFRDAFMDTDIGKIGGYWKIEQDFRKLLAAQGGRVVFDGEVG